MEDEFAFAPEKHLKYLTSLDTTTDKFAIGFYSSEHLKLPGAYWCISALSTLDKLPDPKRDSLSAFLAQCQHETGGFGGNINHDPHLTNTLYAVLILA